MGNKKEKKVTFEEALANPKGRRLIESIEEYINTEDWRIRYIGEAEFCVGALLMATGYVYDLSDK